jgi:hypothetical protein
MPFSYLQMKFEDSKPKRKFRKYDILGSGARVVRTHDIRNRWITDLRLRQHSQRDRSVMAHAGTKPSKKHKKHRCSQ